MSADMSKKLMLTVPRSPRLWLAPAKYTKSLFKQNGDLKKGAKPVRLYLEVK